LVAQLGKNGYLSAKFAAQGLGGLPNYPSQTHFLATQRLAKYRVPKIPQDQAGYLGLHLREIGRTFPDT
jgi:hypothetical protein